MLRYFIAFFLCLPAVGAFAILPDTAYILQPEDLGLKYRDLEVTTRDGYHIATWFFPAQSKEDAAKASDKHPTIIICNGDAGNMSYMQLPLAQAWTAEGFNVATFDWRGFGASSPFPMDRNYLCYTEMLEATVAGGLAEKIPLSTEDYEVSDISLEFNVVGDRVEYIFYCDVEFYVRMFGHSYPTITQRVELTGYHNTKF